MRLGGFSAAPEAFATAARTLQRLDPVAAREAWQHAVNAAMVHADRAVLTSIVREARSAGVADQTTPVVRDLMIAALVLSYTGDEAAARPLRREALTADIDDPGAAAGMEASLCVQAGVGSFNLAAARDLMERLIARDKRNGALENLHVACSCLGGLMTLSGRLDEAFRLFEESADFSRAYGSMFELPNFPHLAFGGRDAEHEAARRIADRISADLGLGSTTLGSKWTTGELHVARCRWSEAIAVLRSPFDDEDPNFRILVLPSLIEAASRAGDDALARTALGRLTEQATAAGTPWGLGLVARCTALVTRDDGAEVLYRQALEHFARADMRLDIARTELVYGEWLRRQRRHTDAIEHLGAAHDAFTLMAARAYADRARTELEAAGGHARRRTGPEARTELTARERQVAEAASTGQTNREIAAQMFISEATVAYHLRKVFQKLDVTSRRDLRDLDL
jgi:DNA-binding CsgD family transcriptional regulator